MLEHWRKISVLLVLLAALGLAVYYLRGKYGLSLDPEPLRIFLQGLGPAAPVAFVLLLCATLPFGGSGHAFVLLATLAFPPLFAFGLSLVAIVLAQLCTFWLYRGTLRRFAIARIPPWLAKYQAAFARRPVRSVFLLRVITFTWQPGSMALSASPVRTRDVVLGTVLGMIPGVAFDVFSPPSTCSRGSRPEPLCTAPEIPSILAGRWRDPAETAAAPQNTPSIRRRVGGPAGPTSTTIP